MVRFLADAQFCTRNGRLGRWSGTIDATDINTALDQAGRTVARRFQGATKLNVLVRPDPPPGSAPIDGDRGPASDGASVSAANAIKEGRE
jgi:hypothetical protein